MITEVEKLEVLQNELKQKENLEYEILNKKFKNKRTIQQRKFTETEYNYPIIRENYNANKQFYMED